MNTTLKQAQRDQGTAGRDDRWKLFLALDTAFAPHRVLCPGCGFDVSPSLVFPDVTYSDDRRAVAGFFDDIEGVLDLVAECKTAPQDAVFRFVRADRARLTLPKAGFDLLISCDTRPFAESCVDYLKVGGLYLTSRTGQDATTLARATEFALAAVVVPVEGDYKLQMIDTAHDRPRARPPVRTTDKRACAPEQCTAGAVSLVFRRIS